MLVYWLYGTLNKALALGGCKFWIYSTVTVFTTHIYFIILISIIAGNFVEIRLPKTAENVFGSLISGDTEQKMSSEVLFQRN
jgi:hypothetical protein